MPAIPRQRADGGEPPSPLKRRLQELRLFDVKGLTYP
jgi:hypothetical protein